MADNIDLDADNDPLSEESDIEKYKMLNTPLEPKDNPEKKKKVAIGSENESLDDNDLMDKNSAHKEVVEKIVEEVNEVKNKVDIRSTIKTNTLKVTVGNTISQKTQPTSLPMIQ